MEGSMPVGNNSTVAKPGSRLRELGLVLPKPPSPLGAYVEASQVGSLLFLSGTLPLVNRKLAISGRLGANLSVDPGVARLLGRRSTKRWSTCVQAKRAIESFWYTS